MSLLMQALKKAERAKQSHHGDDELAKPSEAFDQLLELAPQEHAAAAPQAAAAPTPAFEATALSLSPLEPAAEPVLDDPAPPAADSAPKRARNPAPPPAPPRPRPRPRAVPVLNAQTIRMAALGGAALIVAALFGYIYWHEMYGPGSSRHLPPVPMPGRDLPAATAPAPTEPGLIGAPVAADPILADAPDAPEAAVPPAGTPAYAPAAPPSAPLAEYTPPAPAPQPAQGAGSSRDQMPPDAYMRAESMPPPAPGRAAAQPAQSGVDDIRVARAGNPLAIDPGVAGAYAAYARGDMAAAGQAYQDVLRQDPHNRDAMLGAAAVAVRAGQFDQAGTLYARLLDLDAHDLDALAGMASIRAGDAGQAESRLRQELERNPESDAALFALGNLYARQGRWQEAQQQYFRAHASAPGNADYAFNLAVGLDRLNQGRLAATYYEKALQLGAGGAAFDRAAASTRLRELHAGVAPR